MGPPAPSGPSGWCVWPAGRGAWARPRHGRGVEEGKGRCRLLSQRFHEERAWRRGRRLSGLGVGVSAWDAAALLRAQVTLTAAPLAAASCDPAHSPGHEGRAVARQLC